MFPSTHSSPPACCSWKSTKCFLDVSVLSVLRTTAETATFSNLIRHLSDSLWSWSFIQFYTSAIQLFIVSCFPPEWNVSSVFPKCLSPDEQHFHLYCFTISNCLSVTRKESVWVLNWWSRNGFRCTHESRLVIRNSLPNMEAKAELQRRKATVLCTLILYLFTESLKSAASTSCLESSNSGK